MTRPATAAALTTHNGVVIAQPKPAKTIAATPSVVSNS